MSVFILWPDQALMSQSLPWKHSMADGNMWTAIFLTNLLVWLILSFVVWKKSSQQQHIAAELLQRLELEKTRQVLQALMQGEEKERTRLSKDLHDGVGGLLSAVKMHFRALQSDLSLQHEKGFNHAMRMLDDAIGEVRKTAHNMTPEILASKGLPAALEFFCRNVSHSRKLQISFFTSGELPRFHNNFELSVYRIVQELVNNIIKHAYATTALVQITQHDGYVSITVEDNGIGFKNIPSAHTGIGLSSLEERVRSLNGQLTITASPGCGTTAYMEFNVGVIQPMEMQFLF
ncbi:sensor histidine kinase [Chitinophaga sp. Ak27]|uniref:sensor histidine kinase n=1 Tax=Chitinophaga sp. Ak27 TaxID=2726116 RepID=UPI00145E7ADC|nr:sensor histidine kinase [Chitinophaga sp. Ak27]NLU92703.1 sensor histidine kinase [Chitinophaga sp. Ak27]